MEHEAFKFTKKQNRRLPPKRGQVLKKILKDLFGSAEGKRRGNGLVSRDGKNLRGTRTHGGPAHPGRVLAPKTLRKNVGSDFGDKPEAHKLVGSPNPKLLVVGLVAQAHQPQLKLPVATIQMLPLSLES